jgi:hypothetical protein
MDIETVRRISLARHLFHLATSSLRSSNDLHLFAAVNLMQDAVESFLIAVADHVGAKIDPQMPFDKYFVNIDTHTRKVVPFKTKLLRLNRMRVDAKHHGIQPDRNECDRVSVSVREFFEEASSSSLAVNFSTVSAIDLLDEGEVKSLLLQAKTDREAGDLNSCSIGCRKAIYVGIEQHYNIAYFKDGEPTNRLLLAFSKAPSYAMTKDYIDRHVTNPAEYIQLDHSEVDSDLLKKGVNPTAFWNIWRLTPEVFRTREKDWIVKHDFNKLDEQLSADQADYIFSTTVDLFLAIYAHKRAIRLRSRDHASGKPWVVLARENVPVYLKADRTSTVVATTPPGVSKVFTDYRVTGLDGGGPYWFMDNMEGQGSDFSGYIHNDDVK